MKNRKVQKTFNLKMKLIETRAKSALNARDVTVDPYPMAEKKKILIHLNRQRANQKEKSSQTNTQKRRETK